MMSREGVKESKRWVVKIGSALLTAEGRGLDRERLGKWVDQMADWVDSGRELVLVSSGAVAEGMSRMGWEKRPETLHDLQAAAAIGQMGLVQAWESCFARRRLHTAQVLLTHDDLSNRRRYLNARGTLRALIGMGVIPIINENDTVANEELRFGDNDTLAALVANLVEADLLVLLTDKPGLYNKDPGIYPDATLIQRAPVESPELDIVAGGSRSGLGRGGMVTKIRAARVAARSGTATLIVGGTEPDVLRRIAAGEELGTLLTSEQQPTAARKRWLAGQMQVRGRLELDEGAVRVLREKGKSLLSIGITGASGEFRRGEVVACMAPDGMEVARGLVNYNVDEIRRIMGQPSKRISDILGYAGDEEVIHRDDLVLL
ncbi:MAG: glutamate 5-kinase [Chromatiales bacterium]|jgi:glutamate 5-kinase